jgi:hypothetical protein
MVLSEVITMLKKTIITLLICAGSTFVVPVQAGAQCSVKSNSIARDGQRDGRLTIYWDVRCTEISASVGYRYEEVDVLGLSGIQELRGYFLSDGGWTFSVDKSAPRYSASVWAEDKDGRVYSNVITIDSPFQEKTSWETTTTSTTITTSTTTIAPSTTVPVERETTTTVPQTTAITAPQMFQSPATTNTSGSSPTYPQQSLVQDSPTAIQLTVTPQTKTFTTTHGLVQTETATVHGSGNLNIVKNYTPRMKQITPKRIAKNKNLLVNKKSINKIR